MASAREGKASARRSSKAFAIFIAALFVSAGFAVMLEAFQAPGVAASAPVSGPSPVFATIAAGKIGHAPFRIDSDSGLVAKAASEGWPGDGTISNPFLIQNLDINANDTGAGIFIGNVTKHFRIQGCVVQNAASTSGSSYYFGGAGVLIYNSANGTVTGCFLSHNNYGLWIWQQMTPTIIQSKDMTVTNNVLTHNSQNGLSFRGVLRALVQGNDVSRSGTYGAYFDVSDHVTVTENNASFCSYGIYAYSCDFLSVTWNKAVSSNYGIYLERCYDAAQGQSSGARVENNTVYRSSTDGIILYADRYAKASNNTLFGCSMELGGGIALDFGLLTITADNTVNGKAVMYYHNGDMTGVIVPTNAGEVIAGNVSNLHVSGLSINNASGGVMLYRTTGVVVTGCTFANMIYGVYCYYDPYLEVNGNTFISIRIGVHFRYSDHSMIIGNTFTGIQSYGIQAYEDDDCIIADNVMIANSYSGIYGVYIDGDSTNDTFWSNQMTLCGLGGHPYYGEYLATHHIQVNNTVNGKPLVYLANVDMAWASVGTNIGQLFIVNATRVTIDSVAIGNVSEAVEIILSDNISITNSFFGYAYYGIWASYSENVSIDACALSHGGYVGVRLEYTTDCTLTNSEIRSFSYDVYVRYGSGYRIEGNRLVTSSTAVYGNQASKVIVDSNNCSGSGSYGVYFEYMVSDSVVSNNNLSGVSYGIYSYYGTGNTYIANKMYNGYYDAYEYFGKNDKFYSNMMTHGFYLGGDLGQMTTIEIAPNNTINGKPVYMYRNGDFSATTVPADAGQIIVVNVTGLTISGLTLSTPAPQMIYVDSISGVTITGCTFNVWSYGIYLDYCTGINVLGNIFQSGSYPVYVYSGSGNRIEGNNFTSSSYSVYLSYSQNNLVKNNDFVQDYIAMYIYSSASSRIFDNRMYKTSIYLGGSRDTFVTLNIPVNNTVNGRKVYYYANQNMNNASVPADAGEVILGNVSNIVLTGLVLNNASCGVVAGYCKNVKILNCDLTDARYYAVYLYYSTDCTISGSAFDRDNGGIYMQYSSWNTITGNHGKSIGNYWVYFYYADANTVNGNWINSSYISVYVRYSLRNAVIGNTFNDSYYGVDLNNADANFVHANSITYSRYYAVYMRGSSDSNLITANNIDKSTNYGVSIQSGSDSNMVYANRFARNNGATSTYSASHIQAWDSDGNNAWNSSARYGNLWTDWLNPDANYDSIIDQPYVLAGGSGAKDYYPLSTLAPNAVTDLHATASSAGITLNWTAPDSHGSPITRYVIYRSLNSTSGTVYGNTTTTTFVDAAVSAGQTYYYWVVAENAYGAGAMSNSAHAAKSIPPPDNTVLLIAAILVVIVLIAGVVLAVMRRKK